MRLVVAAALVTASLQVVAGLLFEARAAEGAWTTEAEMGASRATHTATRLADGRVLVTGGIGPGSVPVANSEIYDAETGTWTPAAAMVRPRYLHTATLLRDGRVLAVGGIVASEATGVHKTTRSVEVYDPNANRWTEVAELAVGRSTFTATLLSDGKVLVAGGRNPDLGLARSLGSAEVYDPGADTWVTVGQMNIGRDRHTATLLANGNVLVVGGYKGTDFDGPDSGAVPELYVPRPSGTGGSWVLAADNTEHRFSHTATALPDGSVLVTGGLSGTRLTTATQATATSELYDPAANTWKAVASLATERSLHAALSLGDGRVLVAGGQGRDGKPLSPSPSELFDAATGRWTDAGSLGVARSGPELTLLGTSRCGSRCGKVLLTGGFTDPHGVIGLSSVELYSPGPRSIVSPTTQATIAPGTTEGTTAPGTTPATTRRVGSDPDPVMNGGYDLVAEDGGIFAFGAAPFMGSTGSLRLSRPIVGMATTPTGKGYWLVGSDGGVFAFGDAAFMGSTGAMVLTSPVVGMARTPTGKGYWLVAKDGGVFAFGDARFLGSTAAIKLRRSIVGIAAAPDGNGYALVAADGGVFAFGSAPFLGSTASLSLSRPIVGLAFGSSGRGYRLVASDGGVFAFGDALFLGSTGALRLGQPVVGIATAPAGQGYWLVASDGGVFAFGSAPFLGSTGGQRLNKPMVGMAPMA